MSSSASSSRLDIRAECLALPRRKRVHNTILIALFVAPMVAGFWTAESRSAGGFWSGFHRFFDFPAEVLGEASRELAEYPAHFVHFLSTLIETITITSSRAKGADATFPCGVVPDWANVSKARVART